MYQKKLFHLLKWHTELWEVTQDSVKVYERNFYSHVFDSKSSQIYIFVTLSQPEVNKQTIKGCLENEDRRPLPPPNFG